MFFWDSLLFLWCNGCWQFNLWFLCISGKESTCWCRRRRFHPWVGKIWRRKWQPIPVFLPGKSHEWKSLEGYNPWGHKESDTTERLTHTPNFGNFQVLFPQIFFSEPFPLFLRLLMDILISLTDHQGSLRLSTLVSYSNFFLSFFFRLDNSTNLQFYCPFLLKSPICC